MPSTNGLELLVRKTNPDYGEWLELLEARRVLLKPHLDSVTLPSLGVVECLASSIAEYHFHSIRSDSPIVKGDGRFSLETQGIFPAAGQHIYTPNSGYHAPPGGIPSPDGVMLLWGLTRSGHWILAEIEFQGLAGHKGRGREKALSVDIQEATPARIVERTKSTAQAIWEELGRAIKRWLKNRQWLYFQMEEVARQVEMEERALSLIKE